MLDRLRNILNQNEDTPDHPNQLDNVIEELTSSIETIQNQYQKISAQEAEILSKLNNQEQKHKEKLQLAKQALKEKKEWLAKSLFTESEIINRQVKQYQKIAGATHKTKSKLLAQENQFRITIDQLSTKKALGEANVDASQLKAEISEQLMFLNESDELTKFDELILDAECKSQAFEEIQRSDTSDDSLDSPTDALNELQQMIKAEDEEKRLAAFENQQKIIEGVFGKMDPEEDLKQKDKQRMLIEQLRKTDTKAEKKERINSFFNTPDQPTTPKSSTTTNDNKDRIQNFFK